MKVKRVDEIVIRLAPWEVEKLLKEIDESEGYYDSSQSRLFPLALHDFASELRSTQ